jgi:hypothetical protein
MSERTRSYKGRQAWAKRILPSPRRECAIEARKSVYIMTAHKQVTDLGRAYREGRLDRRPRLPCSQDFHHRRNGISDPERFWRYYLVPTRQHTIRTGFNHPYFQQEPRRMGLIFGDRIIVPAIFLLAAPAPRTINIRGELSAEGTTQSRTHPSPGPANKPTGPLAHRITSCWAMGRSGSSGDWAGSTPISQGRELRDWCCRLLSWQDRVGACPQ